MKTLELVIVGVGGQGTLLASRILGHIAMAQGLDVKVSEVHGMAQRGGSVVTHVRIGEAVRSPMVEEGSAALILSFEQLEALRALPFLAPGGAVVTSTQQISPMPVIMGTAKYPQDVLARLSAAADTLALDALTLAEQAGSQRAANIVLLGAAARRMPFAREQWQDAVRACVPPKTVDINLKAFALGWDAEHTQGR